MPLLPKFTFPSPQSATTHRLPYYTSTPKTCAPWRLAVTLVATPWDASLYEESRFRGLPSVQNPNGVDERARSAGRSARSAPWNPGCRRGALRTDTPLTRALQALYPNPPRVILLSNNGAARLRRPQPELDRRFLEIHGRGKDDDFKRRVLGDGWFERYRAMQQGMREGVAEEAWGKNARFVGYDTFGPAHLGRWEGCPLYSLHCRGRAAPHPLMGDGGSPSDYTHDRNPSCDFCVWSPPVESRNWVFMVRETQRLNPDFRFELPVWDGDTPGKKVKIDASLEDG